MSNDETVDRPPDTARPLSDGSPEADVPVSRPGDAMASATPGGPPTIPSDLPVLAARNTIAFPGTILPLAVGRERSRRAVEQALAANKLIAIIAQRDPSQETPGPDDLYHVGTACMILKLLNMPDGSQNIIAHGIARIAVDSIVAEQPYLRAAVRAIEDETPPAADLEALVHAVRTTAARVLALLPNVPDEAAVVLNNIEAPGALADFLAANLSLDLVRKQALLETLDVRERLNLVNSALSSQLEMLELSQRIQEKVRSQMDAHQREYLLQEQLKAIQQELGTRDARAAELDELRERVRAASMPEAVAREAEREIDRMARIPQASPEYSVASDYVRWLCELPWSVSTDDVLDIARAEEILDADHYDLEKVKRRILEFLAVRKLKPTGRGPILCFAGPPGVGKTSLGQSIARALDRRFIRMSLGGIRDEADIRGHRRTYIGALPGRIIQELRKAGSNNPVFMLDEVDKVGQDFRGDPSSALLEVLDPQQNHSFTDHYLAVPFDLSRVLFIATANYLDPIPPALRDRMEVIDLPGYTRTEKLHIARRYLVPRQLDEHGLSSEQLRFTDEALRDIVEAYTLEAGVRNLEREIGTVCRGVAAAVARGTAASATIEPADLERYLGPRKHFAEMADRVGLPGVATGLAFTPVGGTIIFVEATSMPGRGGLALTGHIGEVMKESAHAAFSLVRSRASEWKIPPAALRSHDIHIHVPAGAIPKDGPSAGVAMLVALVSLLRQRRCRPDVAMTGEITLRGLVLPIGGVKEKVLAAYQAGIKTVILPERNRKDLVDVPAEARDHLEFVFVERVDELLRCALASPRKARQRRARSTKTKRTTRRPATRRTSTKRTRSTSRRAGKTRSAGASRGTAKKRTTAKKRRRAASGSRTAKTRQRR